MSDSNAEHERYQRRREAKIVRAKDWIGRNRERHNENARKYYWRHRDKCLEYAKAQDKRTIKHNGKAILRNVDKPPKPLLCTLCNRKANLAFHHWEDAKPEIGLWICNSCHMAIHRMIKLGVLKARAESQSIVLANK